MPSAFLAGFPAGLLQARDLQQKEDYNRALIQLNQQNQALRQYAFQQELQDRQREQQSGALAFQTLLGAQQTRNPFSQDPVVPQSFPPDGGQGISLPQVPRGSGMPTDAQLDLARAAIARGFPPAAAAGMAGSMTGESGRNLDPYALNPTSGATGMAQWLGPRKDALLGRPDPYSRETQTGYLFDELRGPERATADRLMGERDPARAARTFTTGFERPGNVPMGGREQAARSIFAALSPEERETASDTAVTVAAQTPPQMAGRMSLQQVAQMVERTAGPNTDPQTKMAATASLYKLMNDDARAQFSQTMEWYRFGETHRHNVVTEGRERGADWEVVQTPDGGLARLNRATGQASPVSGLPSGTTKIGSPRKDDAGGNWQILTDPANNQQFMMRPGNPGSAQTLAGEPYKPGGAAKLGPSQGAAGDIETVAKGIANYQIAPLTGWTLRGPWGQAVTKRVLEINPDFQATQFAARQSGARAFATGRQSDTVRSMNVAIDHLAIADDLGRALENNDTRRINQLSNFIQTEMGYEGPVDFNTAKLIVADEVAKAVIGGVGSMTDRQSLQAQLDASNSPQQLAGVSRTLKRLMAGQLGGLRRQYEAATGRTAEDFDKLLSAQARSELEGYTQGQHPQATGQGGPTPGTTRQYQGKTYTFKGGDPNDKANWVESPPGTVERP